MADPSQIRYSGNVQPWAAAISGRRRRSIMTYQRHRSKSYRTHVFATNTVDGARSYTHPVLRIWNPRHIKYQQLLWPILFTIWYFGSGVLIAKSLTLASIVMDMFVPQILWNESGIYIMIQHRRRHVMAGSTKWFSIGAPSSVLRLMTTANHTVANHTRQIGSE